MNKKHVLFFHELCAQEHRPDILIFFYFHDITTINGPDDEESLLNYNVIPHKFRIIVSREGTGVKMLQRLDVE